MYFQNQSSDILTIIFDCPNGRYRINFTGRYHIQVYKYLDGIWQLQRSLKKKTTRFSMLNKLEDFYYNDYLIDFIEKGNYVN